MKTRKHPRRSEVVTFNLTRKYAHRLKTVAGHRQRSPYVRELVERHLDYLDQVQAEGEDKQSEKVQ